MPPNFWWPHIFPTSLWNVWSHALLLFNSAILKCQWALGRAGTLKIMSMLIPLLMLEPSCPVPTAMVPCSLSPTIAETHYTKCGKSKRYIFYSHLNCQILQS